MSRLLRYELRILIDPETIVEDVRLFTDLDALQLHLHELGSPCRLLLIVADDRIKAQHLALPHLTFEQAGPVEEPHPSVLEVFAQTSTTQAKATALASMALTADCDFVLSSDLAAQPEVVRSFELLNMAVLDEKAARRSIEVFVRGHEVPWAFGVSIWQWPWTVFYPHVESGIQGLERLRAATVAGNVGDRVQEYVRSLGLNRWSAIAYTRDKLLFFVLQRRAAKRQNIDLQEFVFELTYYLNHYYLLFWGGLDQVCWIVNGICQLGFTQAREDRRRVGITSPAFLSRLKQKDTEVYAEFQETEFCRWLEMLKLTRHHVAHQGFAMLSPLFETPAVPTTNEEMDRDIERWPEWQEMKKMFPHGQVEAFRSTFRQQWIEKNYRLRSDAAFVVQDDNKWATICPLNNISWEFERFKAFVLGVAAKCIARLSSAAAPSVQ